MDTEEAIRRLDTDEFVTLWTIQTSGVWEKFQAQGYLRGDGRRITFSNFRGPYHWMMDQMKERITVKPLKRGFPVWAWYYPKPDLRGSGHLPRGKIGVRIELKLRRDRILASCFGSWHCVLNNCPLVKSEKDFDHFCDLDPQKNWDKIFDFAWLNDNSDAQEGWGDSTSDIQAVLYEIFLKDIQSVQFFKAR